MTGLAPVHDAPYFPQNCRAVCGISLASCSSLGNYFNSYNIKLLTHTKENSLLIEELIEDTPVSKRPREAAPLSVPWVLTEGATTANDLAWRDDMALVGLSVRGRGVRGLAVEESESCTVTQLITLVRWLRPTLHRERIISKK